LTETADPLFRLAKTISSRDLFDVSGKKIQTQGIMAASNTANIMYVRYLKDVI
jgi:hypothetical protein